MKKINENETDFPIFDASPIKELLIVSGGGGGQKFGVTNNISIYNILNFSKIGNIDTKDILFEKVIASPTLDAVIAVSDNKLTLFELSAKNEFIEKDSKQLFEKSSSMGVILKHVEKNLILFDVETKKLFIFSLENNQIKEIFSTHLDDKILSIQETKNTDLVNFIFSDKILTFHMKTKKFIERSFLMDKKLTRILSFFDCTNGVLGIITFEDEMMKLITLKTSEENKNLFVLQSNQKFSGHQASCCCFLGLLLVIGTVDGKVLLLSSQLDGSFYLFKMIMAHQMPVRGLFLKLAPNSVTGKNDYILTSVGTDSKIKSFMVNHPPEKPIAWQSIMIALLVLCLVLAVYLKRY